MFRFSVAALAVLLVLVPVHVDANAKPSGHRHVSHVTDKSHRGGKHLSAGKTDAKASPAAISATDAAGPTGKTGWAHILRIAAWSVIVWAGVVLVGQRLKDRFWALERERARIGDRVEALKRTIVTGGQRAATAEAKVEASEADAKTAKAEAHASQRRIAELEQDNARLRADRARAVESDRVFASVRVQLEEMVRTRLGHVEPDKGRATLDQHLAALQAAKPGDLAPASVLNGEEQSKFGSILAWTRQRKLKLLPQVSMGEYLEPASGAEELRWTYNDRRADFVICDREWMPILAVEHHGSGHRLGENWEKRDAIKARALVLADVGLVITEDDDRKDVVIAKLDAEYARLTTEGPSGRQAAPSRRGRLA